MLQDGAVETGDKRYLEYTHSSHVPRVDRRGAQPSTSFDEVKIDVKSLKLGIFCRSARLVAPLPLAVDGPLI